MESYIIYLTFFKVFEGTTNTLSRMYYPKIHLAL